MHCKYFKIRRKLFEGHVTYNTYVLYLHIVNGNTLKAVVPEMER